MIIFLRCLFALVLLSMIAVTAWAGSRCSLFGVPAPVFTHPWFIATMADAYWGFITFFVWVCFKRTGAAARASWLVAILLLGNIAMASFCLRELFRVPANGSLSEVLTTRSVGADWLGSGLAALGIAVVALS
jgi:hypothetical protein